jgi:hypothetical protein
MDGEVMKKHDKKQNENISDLPLLILHWGVLENIIKTIGCLKAESGGVLGGNNGSLEVSHYYFDETSQNSAVTYSPDCNLLNELFKSDWNPQGIRLRGFVHSHPGFMSSPSCGDQMYAERILKAINDLDYLWLPIINSVPDIGRFILTPWAVYRVENGIALVKGRIQLTHIPLESGLTICGLDIAESIHEGESLDELSIGKYLPEPTLSSLSTSSLCNLIDEGAQNIDSENCGDEHNPSEEDPKLYDVHNTFDRVQDAYDLDLMKKARIISVGAGGAADWLENLARAGVEQFFLIDFDVVSETNLATQQTYRKDIGRPKVTCIAERIRDINPNAITITIQKRLDEITDDEMQRLATESIHGRKPGRTIICGLTDSFFAQARVNRLALHFGIPSLCAQMYKEGRGGEITFTYPGVTPACHRCILSSRYRYFLEQGNSNDVTSHGTPIFATTRLNATKGFITLALIHHGSKQPRWGDMLSRIGNRNLVQLRLDPDIETMGIKVFDRVFDKADKSRLFYDEVLWLPQKQECLETGHEPCPDCGGTGDLRDAIGRFSDTRLQTKGEVFTPTVDSLAISSTELVKKVDQ